MTTTREVILENLQSHGQCSVNELAALAGVSPVSIRHHLSSMLASGLIQVNEQKQSIGRPKLYYSLTEAAIEQRMPHKYVRLSDRLLAEIKNALPPEQVERLLASIARRRAEDRRASVQGKSLEAKMSALVEMLAEEGFMAEWHHDGDDYRVTEHNCPYFIVGQSHPEICTFDQILISEVLDAPVEKSNCLLDGDQHCVFVVNTETV